jgi:hypothetical protein
MGQLSGPASLSFAIFTAPKGSTDPSTIVPFCFAGGVAGRGPAR